jgi:general L-amino acid transport system substrate-binding protein
MNRAIGGFALVAVAALVWQQPATAQTLKTVKDRGTLVCGVNQGLPGFSNPDAAGNWSGFDVDFCRALAAAIFNDPSKVRYVPLSTAARFQALQSKEVDVLSRNSTWTMERDTSMGLSFPATTYYDGQGFIVSRSSNAVSALELSGVSVCVQTETTTRLNLTDFFKTNKVEHQVMEFASLDEAVKSYDSGRCKTFTTDVSQLYALRLRLSKPDDHVILPDIISKEPLGPAVRSDDAQWFAITRWVHFAMLNAEELGVSSQTIDEAMRSEKPDVKRLVGTEGAYGEQLGLTKDWAARVIKQVGNYGEVFDRNVGLHSKLGIARGLNDLWTKGGIQYAPPIR